MSEQIPLHIIEETAVRGERSDAVANRQRILVVARDLFARRPPESINMSDIVETAGIGRGTLYRNFPTKGELCLALIEEEITAFQNDVLQTLREMTGQGASPLEKLDVFLDALVHFTAAHNPLLREAQRHGHNFFDKKITPQFWQHATVNGLLETAVTHGELPSEINTIYLADLFLASLSAQIFHFQQEERGFTADEISHNLRTLLRNLQCA
jgi:AcrR family transcriptional regulator